MDVLTCHHGIQYKIDEWPILVFVLLQIQKKPSAYGVSFPVPNIMQKWTLVVTFLWRACYIFPRYFLLYFSSVFPSFLGVGWLDCSVNLWLMYCNLPLITAKHVLYCASSYFLCKLLPFGTYSFVCIGCSSG